MKRRLLPSLLLALALALTACASKPAAPTSADFEVQPGAYRYQDIDVFFIETEKGNYCMNPLRDYLIRFAEPGTNSTSCAISPTAATPAQTATHF